MVIWVWPRYGACSLGYGCGVSSAPCCLFVTSSTFCINSRYDMVVSLFSFVLLSRVRSFFCLIDGTHNPPPQLDLWLFMVCKLARKKGKSSAYQTWQMVRSCRTCSHMENSDALTVLVCLWQTERKPVEPEHIDVSTSTNANTPNTDHKLQPLSERGTISFFPGKGR